MSVHLLAYLVDPDSPALAAELARLRAERLGRGERMVGSLVAAGHPIAWERIVEASGGGVVGRPHVARALVEAGVVGSVGEAFTTLLHQRGPHHVAKADTDVLEGIALVRAAGGVPVFAHGLASRRGPVVDDAAIAAMAGAGLVGLEVDHPDHDPADRDHLRGLAGELGLLVTGSSDHHGFNKPTPLGACTTDPGQFEALLAAGTGSAPFADRRGDVGTGG